MQCGRGIRKGSAATVAFEKVDLGKLVLVPGGR